MLTTPHHTPMIFAATRSAALSALASGLVSGVRGTNGALTLAERCAT